MPCDIAKNAFYSARFAKSLGHLQKQFYADSESTHQTAADDAKDQIGVSGFGKLPPTAGRLSARLYDYAQKTEFRPPQSRARASCERL